MDNEPLILDFVEWIARQPRAYNEVLAAWKTSCPRFTVWEDAVDTGLVSVGFEGGSERMVSITEKGRHFLQHAGRELLPEKG